MVSGAQEWEKGVSTKWQQKGVISINGTVLCELVVVIQINACVKKFRVYRTIHPKMSISVYDD